MHRQLFGTDGIRGVAGQYPLDGTGARQIGKAIGIYFAQPGDHILVGCDPRESSPMLVEAIMTGLSAVGVNVKLLGVVPTPGLAYITQRSQARAGVMITASHNPYTDNGIKVFSSGGGKLTDEIEAKLNELIDSDIPDRGTGRSTDNRSLVADYETFLIASAGGVQLEDLHIALDSANGATSGIAARVFQKLGARVVPLFDKPDGKNINVACGATDTTVLQDAVRKQGLSAGAAFDGDGDRLMLIDEQGRQLTGDHILYILALTGQHKGVVATIMSNMGLETALKGHGIVLHRTAVGDRYVLQSLEQTGFRLGGEQSGHIVLPELTTTGDGMLAAIQALKQVQGSGKSLGDWFDELQLLPQALVNIALPAKSLLEKTDVVDYIAAQTAELGSAGRINIRPSGTEPKARVMVESADAAERTQVIADHLTKLFGVKD